MYDRVPKDWHEFRKRAVKVRYKCQTLIVETIKREFKIVQQVGRNFDSAVHRYAPDQALSFSSTRNARETSPDVRRTLYPLSASGLAPSTANRPTSLESISAN